MPGDNTNLQGAASSHADDQIFPRAERLAAIICCIQRSQGCVNVRGNPNWTKSPRDGILPWKPIAASRNGVIIRACPRQNFGHWKPVKSPAAKGLITDPALISKLACRSPLKKLSL
jgi:hypothetical protein